MGPFSGCLPGDGQHWRSVGRPLYDELVEQVARVGFRPVRGSVRPDSEPFQQISLSATGYGYGGPVLHHEAGRITAQHPLDEAHVHQVAVVRPEEAHAFHQALHVLQCLGDQQGLPGGQVDARVVAVRLEPGDVIFTGTPPGVGMGRKPPVWLKAGDEVEVEIAGLGILRNPVVGS